MFSDLPGVLGVASTGKVPPLLLLVSGSLQKTFWGLMEEDGPSVKQQGLGRVFFSWLSSQMLPGVARH